MPDLVSEDHSEVIRTAQEYYDSDDADNFYYHAWGGEDIHVGIYDQPDEDIARASQRTVDAMARQYQAGLNKQTRIINVGAGYGGSARMHYYRRVRRELSKRRTALAGKISDQYMDRMIQGLGHWIDAGGKGYLSWGILHFRKPE